MPEAQVGRRGWFPPSGPLGELTRESVARALVAARGLGALEDEVAALGAQSPHEVAARVDVGGRFARALLGANVAVIAEIKRRSPSKGVIAEDLRAGERAQAYRDGGAAALSVLTEPTRFGGSLDDLRAVRAAVGLPLLRKDFITHRVQLLEARLAGAAVVLLIARALAPDALAALAADAASMGLEVLVEVRHEQELERALAVPGAVVGVNNRNLETLVIEPAVTERLLPMVPTDRAAVYESGVHGVADVERAARLGADAVLVGSVLSAAADGGAAVRALVSVPRQPGARPRAQAREQLSAQPPRSRPPRG